MEEKQSLVVLSHNLIQVLKHVQLTILVHVVERNITFKHNSKVQAC